MTNESKLTVSELLAKIDAGWRDFHAYIATLSAAQLTEPADAAGWTAKDHLMHLAVWEDSIYALLRGLPRHAQMGVDQATFEMPGPDRTDRINDVIFRQHRDKPLAEVMAHFQAVHDRVVPLIAALSDADLQRPYSDYQPGATRSEPIVGWLTGDTYEHYEEHQTWIAALVGA